MHKPISFRRGLSVTKNALSMNGNSQKITYKNAFLDFTYRYSLVFSIYLSEQTSVFTVGNIAPNSTDIGFYFEVTTTDIKLRLNTGLSISEDYTISTDIKSKCWHTIGFSFGTGDQITVSIDGFSEIIGTQPRDNNKAEGDIVLNEYGNGLLFLGFFSFFNTDVGNDLHKFNYYEKLPSENRIYSHLLIYSNFNKNYIFKDTLSENVAYVQNLVRDFNHYVISFETEPNSTYEHGILSGYSDNELGLDGSEVVKALVDYYEPERRKINEAFVTCPHDEYQMATTDLLLPFNIGDIVRTNEGIFLIYLGRTIKSGVSYYRLRFFQRSSETQTLIGNTRLTLVGNSANQVEMDFLYNANTAIASQPVLNTPLNINDGNDFTINVTFRPLQPNIFDPFHNENEFEFIFGIGFYEFGANVKIKNDQIEIRLDERFNSPIIIDNTDKKIEIDRDYSVFFKYDQSEKEVIFKIYDWKYKILVYQNRFTVSNDWTLGLSSEKMRVGILPDYFETPSRAIIYGLGISPNVTTNLNDEDFIETGIPTPSYIFTYTNRTFNGKFSDLTNTTEFFIEALNPNTVFSDSGTKPEEYVFSSPQSNWFIEPDTELPSVKSLFEFETQINLSSPVNRIPGIQIYQSRLPRIDTDSSLTIHTSFFYQYQNLEDSFKSETCVFYLGDRNSNGSTTGHAVIAAISNSTQNDEPSGVIFVKLIRDGQPTTYLWRSDLNNNTNEPFILDDVPISIHSLTYTYNNGTHKVYYQGILESVVENTDIGLLYDINNFSDQLYFGNFGLLPTNPTLYQGNISFFQAFKSSREFTEPEAKYLHGDGHFNLPTKGLNANQENMVKDLDVFYYFNPDYVDNKELGFVDMGITKSRNGETTGFFPQLEEQLDIATTNGKFISLDQAVNLARDNNSYATDEEETFLVLSDYTEALVIDTDVSNSYSFETNYSGPGDGYFRLQNITPDKVTVEFPSTNQINDRNIYRPLLPSFTGLTLTTNTVTVSYGEFERLSKVSSISNFITTFDIYQVSQDCDLDLRNNLIPKSEIKDTINNIHTDVFTNGFSYPPRVIDYRGNEELDPIADSVEIAKRNALEFNFDIVILIDIDSPSSGAFDQQAFNNAFE